jgi:hypothetical protein
VAASFVRKHGWTNLDKTSLADRQAANSFYFLLLILHGPSTRQNKLFVTITTKEKPTLDVRDNINKSRRNTQNTYTILPTYTLHTFLLFASVCGQARAKASDGAITRGWTTT